MTQTELEFLTANLEYDFAKYTSQYLLNMGNGIYDFRKMFSVYLLSNYVQLIAEYDLVWEIGPLDSDEMINILKHVNVIINKNYDYDFH
jgi:hypothetical protein